MPDVASTVHNSITSSAVNTGTQPGRPCTGNSNQMTQTYLVARLPKKNRDKWLLCFWMAYIPGFNTLHLQSSSLWSWGICQNKWKPLKFCLKPPRITLACCYGMLWQLCSCPSKTCFHSEPFSMGRSNPSHLQEWERIFTVVPKSGSQILVLPFFATVKNDWSSCRLSRSSSIAACRSGTQCNWPTKVPGRPQCRSIPLMRC